MKVLLIAPDSPFLFDPRTWPPLGLMYLATALESEGHEAKIVDLAIPGESIAGWDPDLIGITVVTSNFTVARDLVAQCRKTYPGVKILVGGPHLSVKPEDYRKLGADAVCAGDGERVILNCAGDLEQRTFHKFYVTSGWTIEPNEYPFPARHLVPLAKYRGKVMGREATVAITQRGCPMTCGFCVHWHGYRQVRYLSVAHAIEEVRIIKNLGYSTINYEDDEFNVNPKRCVELLKALAPEKITFKANFRAVPFDERLAEALKDAGCVTVAVGVESGSPKILKNIKKGTTPADNSRCRWLCKQFGLPFRAYVVVGLPGETRATLEETKNWLIDNEVDDVRITSYTPYPGTPIFDHRAEYDIQIPDPLPYDTEPIMFYEPIARTAALSCEAIKEAKIRLNEDVRSALGLKAA